MDIGPETECETTRDPEVSREMIPKQELSPYSALENLFTAETQRTQREYRFILCYN